MKHILPYITLFTLLLSFAASLRAQEMDYYLYFLPAGIVVGPSKVKEYAGKGAMEIFSFELSAENATNIGSSTGGTGGAGKVTLNRFYFTMPYFPVATGGLFFRLFSGEHFSEVILEGRRNGVLVMQLSLALVLVSHVELLGTQGDSGVVSCVLDFGAMKLVTNAVSDTGAVSEANEALWSRVFNNASYETEVE
jgi:type VI protein secretion system component Hcp